ncbi:MAG: acyl-CoA thioesterase [Candidatus Binatia bacterium]|jgi:acyl-CoA thioesterase YciA
MREGREPVLRVTMLPRDTNARGTIFGGVILSHIDLAGAVAAHRHAARNFVTKAMHEVEFIAPVYVGDVVSLYATLVREGRTSLTVRVEVEAERFQERGKVVKVTEAEVVYVSIDDHQKPTPIRSDGS